MIGSVMAVPVREFVIGFLLLAYGINGKNEWSRGSQNHLMLGGGNDLWEIAGLATRLTLDMGLHLVSPVPSFS